MTTDGLLAGIPLVTILASIVWLIRLEGRVNTHEAVCAERYRHLQEHHATAMKHLESIDARLEQLMP